jgi:hypothetical protein
MTGDPPIREGDQVRSLLRSGNWRVSAVPHTKHPDCNREFEAGPDNDFKWTILALAAFTFIDWLVLKLV